MRAKVASKAGGHPFEERFLNMTDEQLIISYRYAQTEEEREFEKEKSVHQSWMKRLDNLFEKLYMFTNTKLYKLIEEHKELKELEKELNVDNFAEEWEKMLQSLPEEIIVEEPTVDPLSALPPIDTELEEFYTGFIPFHLTKEGEV